MKVIYVLLILLLLPLSVSGTDDLSFTINYDHLKINNDCLISNTEKVNEISLVVGLNLISVSVYPVDSSVGGCFNSIANAGDRICTYENTIPVCKSYYGGIWWGEPFIIEPLIGYEYTRQTNSANVSITGTFLIHNDCNIYKYFNFKNIVGTNIIRPKRCIYDK